MQNGTSNEWLSERIYGICRVTLLPMYREPVPGSGMSSQLLFGELYQIRRRTKEGDWLFAEGENQAGSGWILASQHQELEEGGFEFLSQAALHVTTSPISKLIWDKSPIYLLPGSQLHADRNELFDWGASFFFEGESRPFSEKVTREQLVTIASTFINAPYLSGGRSIFGLFGGSWLQLVFKIGGYRVPNYLSTFLTAGEEVGLSGMQAADVLIFGNELGIPSRVGLYAGEGRLLLVDGKVRFEAFDPDNWSASKNKSRDAQVLHVKNLVKK
ncbi:C40 family peptidase [Cyclobacterium jeungdonense]|uniref:C40 family peptidase n=1 Tax=Cyclobacterium jeungdonense TaxID=708087 RepID=A0ABT8C520_9BACT|nr:C40 family peptidase [Cyclobacterium jeungdonense]MDN3687202.1 C40 family peptidase [Cyclobacterium jeungdonense]